MAVASSAEIQHDEVKKITSRLGIELIAQDVQNEEEFPRVLETFIEEEVEWLVLEADTMVANASLNSIETLAHRIPTMCLLQNTIHRGGMIGYVACWSDVCQNGANLALKLFEGAPVKQKITRPVKRNLLVNETTARKLKLYDTIKENIEKVRFVK